MMCAPSQHGCEKWSIALRADAVDYNEKTREIDAHSKVHMSLIGVGSRNTVTPAKLWTKPLARRGVVL